MFLCIAEDSGIEDIELDSAAAQFDERCNQISNQPHSAFSGNGTRMKHNICAGSVRKLGHIDLKNGIHQSGNSVFIHYKFDISALTVADN